MLACRGAGGEHPKGSGLLGVSPVPLIPQESRISAAINQFQKYHYAYHSHSKTTIF